MYKLKKSGKIVLILSAVLIFLGIVFTTIGAIKGPTFWLIADTNGIHSGKNIKALKDEKTVEPFNQININNTEIPFTITSGDSYSIKYFAEGLYTDVDYKVENSILKINVINKSVDLENYYCFFDTKNSFSNFNDNYFEITVPNDTVIENINILSSNGNRNVSSYNFYRNLEYTLRNINVKSITTQNNEYINSPSMIIDNSNLETINLSTTHNFNINNSTIGLLKADSEYLNINNSVINEMSSDYDESTFDINNATIGTMKVNCNSFNSINLIVNNVSLTCDDEIIMKNTTVNQSANLIADDDIKFSTSVSQTEFNYEFIVDRNDEFDSEDDDFDEFDDENVTAPVYDDNGQMESTTAFVNYDENSNFVIINGERKPEANYKINNNASKNLIFKSIDGDIKVNFN